MPAAIGQRPGQIDQAGIVGCRHLVQRCAPSHGTGHRIAAHQRGGVIGKQRQGAHLVSDHEPEVEVVVEGRRAALLALHVFLRQPGERAEPLDSRADVDRSGVDRPDRHHHRHAGELQTGERAQGAHAVSIT
ncbi:MAG: hypothetical protein ACN6I7_00770 [bacterium]